MTGIVSGPLTDRLAKLCEAVGHPALEGVRQRLADPGVRVAVVGRLNAGKSTLVNALLTHPVAPVASGECTRVTTWFGYDAHEQAIAELIEGDPVIISLGAHRRLPDDLPVDHASVRRLSVSLSNDTLRSMTLIDTPGMDTTTAGLAEQASTLLGLAGGTSPQVDAVLYVMPQARASDVDRLDGVRSMLADQGAALATIGVLTKTDRLATSDPVATGRQLAEDLTEELRGSVAVVVPVVGLWAETADADGLTEADVRALRRVAELADADRVLALSSAQRFLALDLPGVQGMTLDRLVRRLDMTGVRALLGADLGGAAQVAAQLREWSGISRLRETVDTLIRSRGDLLRAHSAVVALRDIAWSAGLPVALREQVLDGIDGVETAPEYHVWHEARARLDFVDGAGTGDATLDQEAIRILGETTWQRRLGLDEATPPEVGLDVAMQSYRRWTGVVNSAQTSLSARRVAEVVRRSCLICYREVAGT